MGNLTNSPNTHNWDGPMVVLVIPWFRPMIFPKHEEKDLSIYFPPPQQHKESVNERK